MKLLFPLSLILLVLLLCQCRMSNFSTFSYNDDGHIPKVPTVKVSSADNLFDSNYAVLPPETAISDGFELRVSAGTKISEIKEMFKTGAADVSEPSVVGPRGEILADDEIIHQSIGNGESIELLFTDPSGGSLRVKVTGSSELKERIKAVKSELHKLKNEVDRTKDGYKQASPLALLSVGPNDTVTLEDLELAKNDFVISGESLDQKAELSFTALSGLDQQSNGEDHINLIVELELNGITANKKIEVIYHFNFQPDLDKFEDVESSKSAVVLKSSVFDKILDQESFNMEELSYTPPQLSSGVNIIDDFEVADYEVPKNKIEVYIRLEKGLCPSDSQAKTITISAKGSS